jgi:hypothetical protein
MRTAAEIRAGSAREEIFHHYPSLPLDSIEAVQTRSAGFPYTRKFRRSDQAPDRRVSDA